MVVQVEVMMVALTPMEVKTDETMDEILMETETDLMNENPETQMENLIKMILQKSEILLRQKGRDGLYHKVKRQLESLQKIEKVLMVEDENLMQLLKSS